MKYIVEMGSNFEIYTPSFIMIDSGITCYRAIHIQQGAI
jgi:hypothetical protein